MKVAELTGADLALWVARLEGIEERDGVKLYASGGCLYRETQWGGGEPYDYRPDSRWSAGGPIIERDKIFLEPPHTVHALNYGADGKPKGCWTSYETWHATVSARTRTYPNPIASDLPGRVGRGEGATPLIAAMRAKVASHYGATVPDLDHPK